MTKYIVAISFLATCFWSGFSQNYVCNGDTVTLSKPVVRGDFYWQKSNNGIDWSRISEEGGDTLVLIPNESAWYRVEVFEGNCQVVYSSLLKLDFVQLPELLIPKLEELCIDQPAFQLQGESPVGGTYSGPGIVDGRFIPRLAGAGEHKYYYAYTDSISGCKDSISGSVLVQPLPDQANAGEDQLNQMLEELRLSANTPSVGTGMWSIVEGSGGIIVDPYDPSSVFKRDSLAGLTVLEWTITTPCGISKDRVSIEFVQTSINPCPGQAFVYDRDGNRYKTVQIGNQCWMGENLKVGALVASTVESRPHSNVKDNGVIEAYAWKNDLDSLDYYGGLYDWDEMMNYTIEEGTQGICPDGWHVPTRKEWMELDDFFVENDTGHALQVGGRSGFDATLSGNRNANGEFYSLESSNFYWTSSTYTYEGANLGHYIKMVSCNEYLQWGWINKKTGASIRCLKDE